MESLHSIDIFLKNANYSIITVHNKYTFSTHIHYEYLCSVLAEKQMYNSNAKVRVGNNGKNKY
jgi:hypothetical protein